MKIAISTDDIYGKYRAFVICINNDDINIEDSAFIPKKTFRKVLDYIKTSNPTNEVVKTRFYFSAKMEWAVHNFLYRVGLWRDRTKDININLIGWPMKVIYAICGILCWAFVK